MTTNSIDHGPDQVGSISHCIMTIPMAGNHQIIVGFQGFPERYLQTVLVNYIPLNLNQNHEIPLKSP